MQGKMKGIMAVALCLWTLASTDGAAPRRSRRDEGSDPDLKTCLNRQMVVLDGRLRDQNDILDSRLIEQNGLLDSRLQAQNSALDARFYEQQVTLDTLQMQNKALDDRLIKLHPTLDTRLLELTTLVDTRMQALHADVVELLDTRLQEQYKAVKTRFLDQKAALDGLQIQNSALDSRLMEVETAVNTRLLALSADVLKLSDSLNAQRTELDACLHAHDALIRDSPPPPRPQPPSSTAMDYRVHALDEELGSVKRTLSEQSRELTSLRNTTMTQVSQLDRVRESLMGLNATMAGRALGEGASKQPVAFTARFSAESITDLTQGQTLKFDNVLHNQGSGYDLTTGLFTAPTDGTYVFYVQVMRHKDDRAVHADVYRGDTVLARADGCCSSYGTGSAMATQHLQEGDTVHVRINSGNSLFGGMYTSFSGFQLSSV